MNPGATSWMVYRGHALIPAEHQQDHVDRTNIAWCTDSYFHSGAGSCALRAGTSSLAF